MVTAIRKASRSIRPMENCGSRNTGRRAATRSTSSSRAKNYGWPVISYGVNYDGAKSAPEAQKAGMERAGLALDAVDRAVRHGVL